MNNRRHHEKMMQVSILKKQRNSAHLIGGDKPLLGGVAQKDQYASQWGSPKLKQK